MKILAYRLAKDVMTKSHLQTGLKYLSLVGMTWLLAGISVIPKTGDWRHTYEYILVLFFVLPVVFLASLRPSSLRLWWQHPSNKWIACFLAWALLTLVWSDPVQKLDWAGRLVGIGLFLYAWKQVLADKPRQAHQLLIICATIIAATAFAAILMQYPTVLAGGRIGGLGRLSNTNRAAQVMAAATIWLCTLPCHRRRWLATRTFMVAVLLAFIIMTFSRGPWGAMAAALVTICICHPNRKLRWLAPISLILTTSLVALFIPEIAARGVSHRPHILMEAAKLFAQHPILGSGLATPAKVAADGYVFAHTHNMFAQLAVQLGLPGLLLWLVIWIRVGLMGWRFRREPLGRTIIATWVFTSLEAQVALPQLIDSPRPEWLLAWLPVALTYFLPRTPPTIRAKTPTVQQRRHDTQSITDCSIQ